MARERSLYRTYLSQVCAYLQRDLKPLQEEWVASPALLFARPWSSLRQSFRYSAMRWRDLSCSKVQYADPSTKRYTGSLDCARQLVRNHGIGGLYIGLVPTLMFRSFVSVYFGAYELFKRSFSSSPLPVWARNFVRCVTHCTMSSARSGAVAALCARDV